MLTASLQESGLGAAAFGAGEAGDGLAGAAAVGAGFGAGEAACGVPGDAAGEDTAALEGGDEGWGEGEAASGAMGSGFESPKGKVLVKKSPAIAARGTKIPTGITHLGNCFFGGGA